MEEIQLDLDQQMKNLSHAELERIMKEKVDATSARVYFTKRTLSKETLGWLRDNAGGKKTWMYDHLE